MFIVGHVLTKRQAIREHLRVCEHLSDIDNFKILASENTDIQLLTKDRSKAFSSRCSEVLICFLSMYVLGLNVIYSLIFPCLVVCFFS